MTQSVKNLMSKSHPLFHRVTDTALAARPSPELGANVYAFAPIMVHTAGEPFPKVVRNLIAGRVFSVGTIDPAWPGLGVPVYIIPDEACLDRLDKSDRDWYAQYGYITRSGIGWFSSVEEAARRERYVDAPGLDPSGNYGN